MGDSLGDDINRIESNGKEILLMLISTGLNRKEILLLMISLGLN